MLQKIKTFLLSEYGLVFCGSLLLLFGLAYNEMAAFDIRQSVDQKTYWGLAHFDFNQVVVRKYRVIIPFIAAAINWLIVSTVHLLRPTAMNGDYSLRLSFFIINLCCSAVFCTLIYALCRAFKTGIVAAVAGMLVVITSKWTIMNAGTPMVDALYCCMLAMALLAIKRQNALLLFWAIMIGPLAKESFVFWLPLFLFFGPFSKVKMLVWIALSGILSFGYRYLYDHFTGQPMMVSLHEDALHFTYILGNFHRFFESAYINDFIATIGLWPLLPLILLWKKLKFRGYFMQSMPRYTLLFLGLVLLQMLMSGDLARMLYLVTPLLALAIALSIHFIIDERKTSQ